MHYEISQTFFFDAAHTLVRTMETESSLRVHGHTYHAEVVMSGQPHAQTGMVCDLGELRLAIAQLRPQLDHRLLDAIEGLGPGTLENLCAFIWRALAPQVQGLTAVRVWRQGIGDSCCLRAAPVAQ